MKYISILMILCYFTGCSTEEIVNEIAYEPIFISENRQIEAWIYEVGYDEKRPWKSKFITSIKGNNELTISSFKGNNGTTYRIQIMSPGRANYSFRIIEKEDGREYKLWNLAKDEPQPSRIFLKDELIAILEGKVNTKGDSNLTGSNVEYFRYGVSHEGIPEWIGVDYQGRQGKSLTDWTIGDTLFLNCFRRSSGYGLFKTSDDSFHSDRVDDTLEFKTIDIALKNGDCYYFKTKGRKHTGVFRVISVGYFTDEDVQVFRSHKRY